MRKIQATALLLTLVLAVGSLFAQDVGTELKKMGSTNAPKYVGPLMAGWGAGLNSGLFHSADLHSVLGFDVQIKATFAGLSDEDKTYMFQTPDLGPLYVRGGTGTNGYPAEVKANTVVGAKDPTVVKTNDGTTTLMTIPGGLDLPAAPLIFPRFS
ncbi:MAG: hypothetical protein M1339_06370, partial [Bacteroidetes bacterium]|nr:hypothetical protein [Bacteroidota bacterium]